MEEEIIFYKEKSVSKYRANHNYFSDIDTEEKAYILGFLIADGNIEVKQRGNCFTSRLTFSNSIDDFEIIELIRNQLSPDIPLYKRDCKVGAKNRKDQICFRIVSSKLCNTLIEKYNILPRKTLHSDFKFDFDLIPIELQHHFIRGFFDGDGSVSFYETKNTLFFNFSFVFTSKIFAEQIAKIFEDKFNIISVYRETVGKTCTYYTLRFNYNRNRVEKVNDIYNWLYKDTRIFLNRKRSKFIKYFEYRGKLVE